MVIFWSHGNEENAPAAAFQTGLITEKAETERDFFGLRRFFAPEKIKEERLAAGFSFGIVFGMPDRPDGGIIFFDAAIIGNEWFEGSEEL